MLEKQTIDGILLLDKPLGITSNKALQIVKRLFKASKAGHTGSLDPLATGMLPLCFGEATKFSQVLLDAKKSYRVIAKLGETTNSGDREGEIIRVQEVPFLSHSHLMSILDKFIGQIAQIPPMYSALKHQGQPLYKLARCGIEIERKPRLISIYNLQLEAFNHNSLTLKVSCSKGTYIRSLIHDIGEALGCGAHITYLRRLTVANYAESQMLSLEQLQNLAQQGVNLKAYLLPFWSMLETWPNIILSEIEAQNIRQGKVVTVDSCLTLGEVRLTTKNNEFVGIAELLSDGKLKSKRLTRTS